MNFGLAYSATIKKFSLKVTHLSNQSEVHRSVISRFKESRSINTENLERLVLALDDDAFVYWISQIVRDRKLKNRSSGIQAFNNIIEQLDEQETAGVLSLIATKLRQEAEKEKTSVLGPFENVHDKSV